MLKKLLFKNQDKKQLIIAMIGAFLGITFLITSIHFLIKVNDFGKGSEILGPNTVIVQKKIGLGLSSTNFSENEIKKMIAEPFIEDVKPIIANNFNVSFETDDPLAPYFRSDVFIQTVDPKFIDVKPDNWEWEKGDDFVPMILPRDFLVMLNTFMSASDITQISDELAKTINFRFTLSNDDNKEWVDVKIIGFTNEVSAILVPESFMEYGNLKYADGDDIKITQIMISGKENEFGNVEELLKRKGLESKNAQMVVGRLKSIIGTLFLVVLAISIIAVFVSGLVLIQYLQLLMTRNSYEVRTLIRIGYPPNEIVKRFFFYFVRIFGVIALIGILIFIPLKMFIDGIFRSGGIHIDTGLTFGSVLALIIAYLLFILSSYRTAKKGIFNEY